MTDFARYDRIQRLRRMQRPTHNKPSRVPELLILCAVLFLVTIVKECPVTPRPADIPMHHQRQCSQCHNRRAAMTRYFERAGATVPEQMADAVLATRSPRLLAAVHVAGEKCTPYTVRHGGYKHRHAGAWQVSQRDWGTVPHDPVGQALQSERILTELTAELPVRKALNVYGGDSSGRYAEAVLAELERTP